MVRTKEFHFTKERYTKKEVIQILNRFTKDIDSKKYDQYLFC